MVVDVTVNAAAPNRPPAPRSLALGPPADPGRRAERCRAPGARARPAPHGCYFSMMASTSLAESTRYSSPAYFTSVPPYLLYSTTSPVLTSIGTRLEPASSNRPGPTAMTSPSCG